MSERPTGPDSIATLFTQLIDDGRRYAHAELRYYQAIAGAKARAAKAIMLLGIFALVCILAAAIGLVVGLIMILVPLVGAALATLIVVTGFLFVAAMLGWLASRRVKQLFNGKE